MPSKVACYSAGFTIINLNIYFLAKKVICLWSSPRNISTALMYAFRQRPDTKVLDEPLYAHYLSLTGLKHPAYEEILNSQDRDGNRVFASFFTEQFDAPVLFCKQMTHHLEDIDLQFLLQTENILFIRNPLQIIASYSKVIAEVRMEDIGIKKQWELFQWLSQNQKQPIILDAADLLENPSMVLHNICTAVEIDYHSQMLQWEKGPKPEDGIWAPYWYANVHQSTGFGKPDESVPEIATRYASLANEAQQYYHLLSAQKTK